MGRPARTMMMLRALAASPGGLTTGDLATRFAADVTPRRDALGRVGVLMRRQAGFGMVRAAGTVPACLQASRVVVWEITDAGRAAIGARPPLSQRERCVLALAVLGEPTTTQVCDWLERSDDPIGRGCAKAVLRQLTYLAPPLAEVAAHGRSGRGRPSTWRLTSAGREWVAAAQRAGRAVPLREAS